MNKKEITDLISRYALLILIAIPNLYLFYMIFTPLTINAVYFILNLLGTAYFISNDVLLINKQIFIYLIPACIAASAYYLLVALNLTTPMKPKTRIKSILFLLVTFLILNIIRITAFTYLAISSFQYFDLAHKATWLVGSTLFVVVLWFVNVRIFKIKTIPVVSDFKAILKDVNK